MPAACRDEPEALNGNAHHSEVENENRGDVERQEEYTEEYTDEQTHEHTYTQHSSTNITTHNESLSPVWLQESAKTFKYKWVPLPIRKAARATAKWVNGPIPPRVLEIRPFFPTIQEAPIKLLDRYVPKRRLRILLLAAALSIWFLVWSLMLAHLSNAGYVEGYGKTENIWCGYSFWRDDNGCGLNGDECRPFATTNLVFKCPANCLGTHLLEKHWVGNRSHEYSPLVVGGPPSAKPDQPGIYRGDSFVCQAAIHAGVINAASGGCGIASLVGGYTAFESTLRNGVRSFGFPSTFPKNFYFPDPSEYDAKCPADSRWGLFAVTAVTLVIISLFTTSPGVFFFSTFVVLMFHVGLVSDPPNAPNFQELLSTLAARLLPASFISIILYRFCVIPLLKGCTAQVEKTILYLGFAFIGALNNYTFAPLIPIERLTPHDLSQPGAPLALACVLTVIITIVIFQVHYIRVSGNMPRYLIVYALICSTLILLLALPGQRLRIHHYILGIVFMPGTFTKTRACLAYQGLLLGLFINGVARWGFASIIQTPAALGEAGGGHSGTWWGSVPPNITASVAPDASNITFSWGQLPSDLGVDGISILINDVERWRGYVDNELFWDPSRVTLDRGRRYTTAPEPEFYRFAWMNGGATGRYSDPGVWDEHDVWHPVPKR